MYFDRLEKNLIDIIKEEQAKLGFRKEAIRLYYPLSSLNHFFENRPLKSGRFFLRTIRFVKKRQIIMQGFLDFRLLLRKSWEMSRLRLKKTASAFIFRKTAASMCMSIPMPTNLSAV